MIQANKVCDDLRLALQRTDTLELPLPALREALINALVHRDYTHRGRNIKVAVFDDRVKIISPGGLPNGLTSTHLHEGRSELRNRVIARVFKELGLIEQWGSGLQRMRQACLEQDVAEPVIEEAGDFFEVTFWRLASDPNIPGEIESKTPKKSSVKSSVKSSEKSSVKILHLLSEIPDLTIPDLAEQVGISTRAIEKQLKKLQEQDQLKRIGPDKGGYWQVSPPR